MEDEAILDLFFARSEEAIRAVEQKYGRLCRGLSLGIVGNEQDAEEYVSDAWLGAWNAIPPARPSPLSAYLCRIVRNRSLKRRRKNRADKRGGGRSEALEELAGVLSAPDTAESAVEARELVRLVEGFLDALSPEDRAIFLGRYWFAAPCAQIGRRVGLSEGAVFTRLSRLRQKMKRYFAEQGVFL